MLPPDLDARPAHDRPVDARSGTVPAPDRPRVGALARARAVAGWAAVSAIFLASAVGLSATKLIWFDEIISCRIAGLPRAADIWTALAKDGPDVTPPLNFLLIRASTRLLGEGPLAARMPSIVGMWALGACVFAFTARRYRPEYCWAAVFLLLGCDVLTYAIEARPYGAMLGFVGVALLAWQAATERRWPVSSRLALWASLACAVSCHYYAVLVLVPFGLGELARMASRRRFDWGLWAALVGSMAPLGFYLPIIRRAGIGSSYWSKSLGGPLWSMALDAYRDFLGNATIGLVAAVVLGGLLLASSGGDRFGPVAPRVRWALVALASAALALTQGLIAVPAFLALATAARLFSTSEGPEPGRPGRLPRHEAVMLIGLAALPFLGMLLALRATNAFTNRYVFPTVIGLSILAPAVASAASGHRAWAGRVLALAGLIGLLSSPLAAGLRDAIRLARGKTSAASTGRAYVDAFREEYPVAGRADLAIAHIDDYLRLHYYADDALRARIYCVLGDESANQPDLPIRTGIPNVPYNIMTTREFLGGHRDFYLLNAIDPPGNGRSELVFNKLIESGVRVRLERVRDRSALYRCEAPGAAPR